MENSAWPRRANYTFLARLDWLMMIFITFPVPFIAIYRDEFSVVSIFTFIAEFGFSFLFTVMVGTIVDRFRGSFSPASRSIDAATFSHLQQSLNEQGLHPPSLKVQRMRFVPSDLSMGAHVRGIVFPYVVVSAGMLVGLLRKNPDANAILSHEISHLDHFDRFLPGLIGLCFFQIAGSAFKIMFIDDRYGLSEFDNFFFLVQTVIYQLIVFTIVIICTSRYREYYADANALCLSIEPERYLALLRNAEARNNGKFSLFHPSLTRRVSQSCKGFVVLQRTIFWKIYLLMAGTVSLIQYLVIEEGFIVKYAMANFFACLICLGIELIRPLLFRFLPYRFRNSRGPAIEEVYHAKKNHEKSDWALGPKFALIAGFIVVIYLSDIFSDGDKTVTFIGAALVYGAYRWWRST